MARKKKETTAVIVPTMVVFTCHTTYHYLVKPHRCGDKSLVVSVSADGMGGTLDEALADAKKKCHFEAMSLHEADNMEVLGFFSTVTLSNGGTFNTFGGKE